MWSLANPTRFLSIADRVIPWLAGLTFLLLGIGLYLSFFVAPPDYQQGETVKIMFVHVPAAWLAMFGYTLIAIASLGSLIWRHPLADVAAKTAAPIGATFTFRRPGHRLAVGQADVGHLVGVGRAADLGAGAVPPLSRPDRALAGDRRAGPRRPRRRHPGAGRRHQRADHQVLGGLVEHPAPAREHLPGWAARPSIRPCSRPSSSWRPASRCCSCCCTSSPCAPRSCAAACTRFARCMSSAPPRPKAQRSPPCPISAPTRFSSGQPMA